MLFQVIYVIALQLYLSNIIDDLLSYGKIELMEIFIVECNDKMLP